VRFVKNSNVVYSRVIGHGNRYVLDSLEVVPLVRLGNILRTSGDAEDRCAEFGLVGFVGWKR
jgi:hypothetical protein